MLSLLGDHAREVAAEARLGDPKNQLQELAARLGHSLPSYKVRDQGPDHAKVFFAQVTVDGDILGHGTGPSKKHAERVAAAAALEVLAARPGDVAGA